VSLHSCYGNSCNGCFESGRDAERAAVLDMLRMLATFGKPAQVDWLVEQIEHERHLPKHERASSMRPIESKETP
jgi:hypothetical protein